MPLSANHIKQRVWETSAQVVAFDRRSIILANDVDQKLVGMISLEKRTDVHKS